MVVLKSMTGKQPIIIFTYQCQTMMDATDLTFLKSAHRLCRWHISQNTPSHFEKLNGDATFKRMWNRAMKREETVHEFEDLWSHMMTTYELIEHNWFQGMHRLHWSLVFTNHLFSVGLKTTSRSEGTNSALKRLVKSSSSLYDVVLGFEELQETWRCSKKSEDVFCIWILGQYVRYNQLLVQAAPLYTREVYSFFDYEVAFFFQCNNPLGSG